MKNYRTPLLTGGIALKVLLVGLLVTSSAARIQAQVVVQIGQNFTASTLGVDSGALPPDANGAAGPNHYVEWINGRFAVFNKTNGSLVKTMSDLTFWSQAGVTIAGGWGVTDPRLVFDAAVQRWFGCMVDMDLSGVKNFNHFLLAVSASADPTGTWRGVSFLSDTNSVNFADYPRLGLDSQGVYLSGDMFDASGNPVGSSLVSIPKTNLLGTTLIVANRSSFNLLSYASYGNIPQPAVCLDNSGHGNILAAAGLGYDFTTGSAVTETALINYVITNAAGPGLAGLASLTTIPVPDYTVPWDPIQPDGSSNLGDGDARFTGTVYKVGGVLYAVHSTEIGNQAAIRWYRLDASNHSVLEAGTITNATLDLFYPSIAANASGTVAICYNGSSISSYVSAYASVGQTVNGVTSFGNPILLKAGTASYQDQPGADPATYESRWGDYTATCVDPADPNRFWTIQIYPSGPTKWSTQITELRTAVPNLAIARTGTNVTLSWPGTAVAFNLLSNTNLTTTNWTVVTGNFAATNGLVYAQVPITAGPEFFRLQQR